VSLVFSADEIYWRFALPGGRVVKNTGGFEYQYAIADHQGNTRVVFTSATPTPDITTTNFNSNSTEFENDDILLSTMWEMNHSTSGVSSQRLTGGYNAQVGATRTFKVYPGDKVKVDVYAKFRNLGTSPGNLLQFATALTSAFGLSPASTGEFANAYAGMNSFGAMAADADREEDDDASPKGFVTILVFDKHRNFVDAAWDQIDDDYDQTGVENNDPFDLLTKEVTIKEEGYVYIFLSNENPSQVDIHFDDFKITHTKTNVIQYNEYYPFGLSTSTSWTRENNSNAFLYNEASELNNTSGWYDLPFRNYDASLGRFMQIDLLAHVDHSTSPFAYSGNNPVVFNDPTGLLKATKSELYAFINKALSNRGGRWSESADSPTYYEDDFEGNQAAFDYHSNWSGAPGEGGSYVRETWGAPKNGDGYAIGSVVENSYGKWTYSGDGKWVDESTEANYQARLDYLLNQEAQSLTLEQLLQPSSRLSMLESDAEPMYLEGGFGGGAGLLRAIGTHLHHAFPKFLGGLNKGNLVKIAIKDHKALHKELNVFLEPLGMAPSRSNPGRLIRENHTYEKIVEVLTDFYTGPGAKYTEAASQFFKYLSN
jgi:RHS repeat-associated protein